MSRARTGDERRQGVATTDLAERARRVRRDVRLVERQREVRARAARARAHAFEALHDVQAHVVVPLVQRADEHGDDPVAAAREREARVVDEAQVVGGSGRL